MGAALVPLAIGVGGFFAKKAIGSLFSKSKSDSSSKTVESVAAPSVADDTAAAKKRRLIGRSALVKSQQDDILGGPSIGRNELTAI